MKHKIRDRISMLLLLLLTTFAVNAAVTMKVEYPRGKNSISVGDIFWIRASTNGSNITVSMSLGDVGANVLYSSPQFDGRGNAEYVITLRAMKAGTYTFGPININGTSKSVKYTIKGGGDSRQQTADNRQQAANNSPDPSAAQQGPKFIGKGDSQLFLRASVSRSNAYEQEALTYTVKLYTTYDGIRFIGATAAPTFDGFTVEETKDVSNHLTMEQYEGKTYATAVIARYIIFPQMPGKLKVTGNTYTVAVDASEYYDDPYFSRITVRRPIQLNVTPNDLEVDVKALPTPRPANFSGGVGKFSISSSLPSQQFATNQASSIIYTVTGQGNLKYVQLPDLSTLYPQALEVFDPTSDVKASISNGTLSGTVKFDCPFTPLEEGKFTIPNVQLVYFNPETGKYETATARGYKIDVVKGKGSDKSQTKARLRFNNTLLPTGKLQKEHTPVIGTFGYWCIWIGTLLVLILVLFLYRRRLKELGNLALLRSKKAGSVARKRLKKAAAYMRKGEREQFFTEMLRATWGFLSDRLQIPQSDLNRDNVRQAMTDAGCTPEQCDEILNLLDDCEFAKYASGAAALNMQSIYDRGAQIINEIGDIRL